MKKHWKCMQNKKIEIESLKDLIKEWFADVVE